MGEIRVTWLEAKKFHKTGSTASATARWGIETLL